LTGIIWAVAIAQCISPVTTNAPVRETVAVSCAEGSMRVYKYEPTATPVAPKPEVKPQRPKAKTHNIKRKPGKRKRKYRRKR
jgi:hypothetical protein